MAINTPQRRASVLGVAIASTLLVVPNGSVSQPDRQTIGLSYSGIQADIPIIITPDCYVPLVGLIGSVAIGEVGLINASDTVLSGEISEYTPLLGAINGSDTILTSAIDPEGLYSEGQIQEYLTIDAPLCD